MKRESVPTAGAIKPPKQANDVSAHGVPRPLVLSEASQRFPSFLIGSGANHSSYQPKTGPSGTVTNRPELASRLARSAPSRHLLVCRQQMCNVEGKLISDPDLTVSTKIGRCERARNATDGEPHPCRR